jgi:hypothetical protein
MFAWVGLGSLHSSKVPQAESLEAALAYFSITSTSDSNTRSIPGTVCTRVTSGCFCGFNVGENRVESPVPDPFRVIFENRLNTSRVIL